MLFPLGVVNQRNISLAGLPLTAIFASKSYTPVTNGFITIKNINKIGDLPYAPIPELATFPIVESDKTDYKSDSFFTGLTPDELEYLVNYYRDDRVDGKVKEFDCIALPLFFIDDRLPSFWVNRYREMDSTGGGWYLAYYKPVTGGRLYTCVTQVFIPEVSDEINIIGKPKEFGGQMQFNFTTTSYNYTYASSANSVFDFETDVYQYRDITVTAKRCTLTSVNGEGSYYYNYNRSVRHNFYMDKPTALSYGPLTPCTPDQFSTHSRALDIQYGQWSVPLELVGKNTSLTVGGLTTSVNELDWPTNLHRHAIAFPASYGITSVTSSNPNVQIRKRQFSIAAGNGGQRLMDEWLISFPYALTTSITFSK